MQSQCALFEQIEQAPRCCDKNVHAALECLALFPVTNAAVHEGYSQISEAPIIAKGRLHLRCEFARGLEHQ